MPANAAPQICSAPLRRWTQDSLTRGARVPIQKIVSQPFVSTGRVAEMGRDAASPAACSAAGSRRLCWGQISRQACRQPPLLPPLAAIPVLAAGLTCGSCRDRGSWQLLLPFWD